MNVELSMVEAVTIAELLLDDSPNRKEEKMAWAASFLKAAFAANPSEKVLPRQG